MKELHYNRSSHRTKLVIQLKVIENGQFSKMEQNKIVKTVLGGGREERRRGFNLFPLSTILNDCHIASLSFCQLVFIYSISSSVI